MTVVESEAVRCFIAVELSADVKKALASVQQGLQVQVGRAPGPAVQQAVRWVAPDGIHLTLKFLASTRTDQLPAIEHALHQAVAGAHPCQVVVSGLGMFPGQTRPRVIWVGVGGDLDDLAGLQRRIDLATVPLGFPAEQRDFSPHLTLARIREELGAAERRSLGGVIAAERFDARLVMAVREISLMRSELVRGGAKYSRIAAVHLGQEAQRR